MIFRFLIISFFFLSTSLVGRPIETFYGIVEVEEPVLLELIDSPAFQRLKKVHQYGVSYYTTHREEFTRYSHSLGVFHLLRNNNRSLEEQIAGLLHDVSHTVFSHVGDWVFNKEHKEIDYQNSIHEEFLEKTGLSTILRKHKINPKNILPLENLAPALEQKRPNASADRLDYSIQGAYHQNFITKKEALELFKDCKFINDKWISSKPDLMAKIVSFTLFMTEDCFASPTNHLSSRWLADAIIKAIEIGVITKDEFLYGTDEALWSKLTSSREKFIQERMQMVIDTENLYILVDPKDSDFTLVTKFWGFDPWISEGGKIVRLTSLNKKLEEEYHAVKDRMARGFSIKLLTQEKATSKSS
jgi:HD superfamily phosphohydrolase